MNWRRYREATLLREGCDWEFMKGADLIIGGLNFSMDFMYVVFHNHFQTKFES
jgi:hypothetical protein